ncbi:MAG: DUF1684 domain-containing protein [Acidobacteriota bacterium]
MHQSLNRLTGFAVVVSLAAAGAPPWDGPVKLTREEAATIARAIEQDRAESERALKSDPTSYLAAVARQDFGARKTLTVGAAGDNDLQVTAPGVAAHHLRVGVDGEQFHLQAVDAAARFTPQTKGPAAEKELREATVGPSYIRVGRLTLRLSHQGFPAIIVFDPESPHFKTYKGYAFFPVDLQFRYELTLTPTPRQDTVIIMSTRGNQRPAQRLGWFDFLVGKVTCRLEAVRLLEPGVGENDVSIFFRIARYVDAIKQPNGRYLVDFNTASNPACAYSEFYNCPIPPKANVLKVAIRAGEKDSHYH